MTATTGTDAASTALIDVGAAAIMPASARANSA
jgi:hypothetical protein